MEQINDTRQEAQFPTEWPLAAERYTISVNLFDQWLMQWTNYVSAESKLREYNDHAIICIDVLVYQASISYNYYIHNPKDEKCCEVEAVVMLEKLERDEDDLYMAVEDLKRQGEKY